MRSAVQTMTIMILLATANVEAFEFRTGVVSSTGKDGEYVYDGKTYNSSDSVNILIEIDDYWKINHGKFGWGWRLGGSYPLNTDEWYYGTTLIDAGFAFGYDIIKDLTIKGEIGAGLDYINEDNRIFAMYLGLGLDYILADHYILGVSVRQYEEHMADHWKEDSTYDYTNVKTTLYVGYRF